MTRPPRLTIAALMAGVALAALSVAALRSADDDSAVVVVIVTLALVAASLVAAAIGRGVRRACLLFAASASTYLLVSVGLGPVARPWLPTTIVLRRAYPYLARPPSVELRPFAVFTPARSTMYKVTIHPSGRRAERVTVMMPQASVDGFNSSAFLWTFGPWNAFERVGHCLAALWIGALAALLAGWLCVSRLGRKAGEPRSSE